MAARKAGSSDSMATARPCAMSAMSSMVRRFRSKRTARRVFFKSARCISVFQLGCMPEIVEVEPLQRRTQTVVFQSARVVGRPHRQRGIAALARNAHGVAEKFEVHFRAASPADREQQIHRALQGWPA